MGILQASSLARYSFDIVQVLPISVVGMTGTKFLNHLHLYWLPALSSLVKMERSENEVLFLVIQKFVVSKKKEEKKNPQKKLVGSVYLSSPVSGF